MQPEGANTRRVKGGKITLSLTYDKTDVDKEGDEKKKKEAGDW